MNESITYIQTHSQPFQSITTLGLQLTMIFISNFAADFLKSSMYSQKTINNVHHDHKFPSLSLQIACFVRPTVKNPIQFTTT